MLEDLRASLDKVGPPVKVLPVDDVARAALRDQIMLQGPARTRHAKDGSLVKTGAGSTPVEVDRTNGFVTDTMSALANVTAEGVTQDTLGRLFRSGVGGNCRGTSNRDLHL